MLTNYHSAMCVPSYVSSLHIEEKLCRYGGVYLFQYHENTKKLCTLIVGSSIRVVYCQSVCVCVCVCMCVYIYIYIYICIYIYIYI